MAEYISTFITGFQKVVEADLVNKIKGIKILNIFDGLIHYSYNGNSRDLDRIIYFNNTFFVLKTQKGKGLNFQSLIGAVCSEKKYFMINKGTFRVRFIKENQFTKVDKSLSRRVEEYILRNSKLSVDRLSPDTEIWFSIRRENFAFCGQLISKREFTEKNLNKGELRPEFAYLMCAFADIPENAVIAEPFSGYGSIPVQLAKKFNFNKLYVSEIDEEKIINLKSKKQLSNQTQNITAQNKTSENKIIEIFLSDALELSQIQDNSVDVVITDPPWGYYEELPDIKSFYKKMFLSLKRIIKKGGQIVLLSARTEELESVLSELEADFYKTEKSEQSREEQLLEQPPNLAQHSENFSLPLSLPLIEKKLILQDSLHTLVNGKKATLYKINCQ